MGDKGEDSSRMQKPASRYGKTLKSKATVLGLMLILSASLFASMCLSQSGVSQERTVNSADPSAGSDEPVYTAGWNVTSIGTVEAADVGAGVIFKDNFVFWRIISSTEFAITAFSLSSHAFKDVWDSNNSFPDGGGVDMKTINNSVFAEYDYSISPSGSYIAIIWSSDLNTWTQYYDFKSILWGPESFCQYTGPGPFNGMIEYGGYVPNTCAAICAWNSTSNSEIDLFDGTFYGSDDVCFLTMFNSTCMIGGDCGPSNIIYTNDGQNWTDEYSPSSQPAYTSQYPFAWGWAAYVCNGTAYIAEESSVYTTGAEAPLYQGGLMTWSSVGTTTASNYNTQMESIANGLIGGSARLWTGNKNYGARASGGPAVLYHYNPDGTVGPLVWNSAYNGTVKNLTYDPDSGAWYAAVFSLDLQNVTIIEIT